MEPWLDGAIGQMNAGLLLFARFTALVHAAPLLSGPHVPRHVRLGLSAMLTLLLVPLAPPCEVTSAAFFLLLVGKEVLYGLILGWAASLVFAAVQMAGEWLDLSSGFHAATLLDPGREGQTALLGQFMHLIAVLVFLGTGSYALVLRAAAGSLEVSPPGVLRLGAGTLDEWLVLVTRVMLIAVQLAAPAAAALFLVEVALALANRALPQMNVLMLSLSIKACLTLGFLALAFTAIVHTLQLLFSDLGPHLSHVMRLLRG